MRKKKPIDVYVYEWKKDEKVLGYGVTSDIKSREKEHCKEEPRSVVKTIGRYKNETSARKIGINKLKSYVKEHGSLPPKNGRLEHK
jgi:hypothetical protein